MLTHIFPLYLTLKYTTFYSKFGGVVGNNNHGKPIGILDADEKAEGEGKGVPPLFSIPPNTPSQFHGQE